MGLLVLVAACGRPEMRSLSVEALSPASAPYGEAEALTITGHFPVDVRVSYRSQDSGVDSRFVVTLSDHDLPGTTWVSPTSLTALSPPDLAIGQHELVVIGPTDERAVLAGAFTVCEATATWYRDADGDLYGDPVAVLDACLQPEGYTADPTDCDDSSASTYPGAAASESTTACMKDEDGDGFGDTDPPTGVTAGSDCDDTLSSITPEASEICDNGVDDNCDHLTDGDDGLACPPECQDLDLDGHLDAACGGTDCDDSSASTYPGAAASDSPTACMKDGDGDGFGDANPPVGVISGLDCDDASAVVQPGTPCLDDGDPCTENVLCLAGACTGHNPCGAECGDSCAGGCGVEGCCVETCSGTCATCESGCGCDQTCSGSCTTTCNAGAACHLQASGSEESSARLRCADGASCALTCARGEENRCRLDCLGNAACLLDCNGETSCTLSCAAPVSCGADVHACNRPCP